MNTQSLDLKTLQQQFVTAAKNILRYHLVIVLLIASAFLIATVLTVNSILINTKDDEYAATQLQKNQQARFKPSTIEKINELRSRQENPVLSLPEGRRNPFVE